MGRRGARGGGGRDSVGPPGCPQPGSVPAEAPAGRSGGREPRWDAEQAPLRGGSGRPAAGGCGRGGFAPGAGGVRHLQRSAKTLPGRGGSAGPAGGGSGSRAGGTAACWPGGGHCGGFRRKLAFGLKRDPGQRFHSVLFAVSSLKAGVKNGSKLPAWVLETGGWTRLLLWKLWKPCSACWP